MGISEYILVLDKLFNYLAYILESLNFSFTSFVVAVVTQYIGRGFKGAIDCFQCRLTF